MITAGTDVVRPSHYLLLLGDLNGFSLYFFPANRADLLLRLFHCAFAGAGVRPRFLSDLGSGVSNFV